MASSSLPPLLFVGSTCPAVDQTIVEKSLVVLQGCLRTPLLVWPGLLRPNKGMTSVLMRHDSFFKPDVSYFLHPSPGDLMGRQDRRKLAM